MTVRTAVRLYRALFVFVVGVFIALLMVVDERILLWLAVVPFAAGFHLSKSLIRCQGCGVRVVLDPRVMELRSRFAACSTCATVWYPERLAAESERVSRRVRRHPRRLSTWTLLLLSACIPPVLVLSVFVVGARFWPEGRWFIPFFFGVVIVAPFFIWSIRCRNCGERAWQDRRGNIGSGLPPRRCRKCGQDFADDR